MVVVFLYLVCLVSCVLRLVSCTTCLVIRVFLFVFRGLFSFSFLFFRFFFVFFCLFVAMVALLAQYVQVYQVYQACQIHTYIVVAALIMTSMPIYQACQIHA